MYKDQAPEPVRVNASFPTGESQSLGSAGLASNCWGLGAHPKGPMIPRLARLGPTKESQEYLVCYNRQKLQSYIEQKVVGCVQKDSILLVYCRFCFKHTYRVQTRITQCALVDVAASSVTSELGSADEDIMDAIVFSVQGAGAQVGVVDLLSGRLQFVVANFHLLSVVQHVSCVDDLFDQGVIAFVVHTIVDVGQNQIEQFHGGSVEFIFVGGFDIRGVRQNVNGRIFVSVDRRYVVLDCGSGLQFFQVIYSDGVDCVNDSFGKLLRSSGLFQ